MGAGGQLTGEDPALERLLDELPTLAGRWRAHAPLSGGLTNRNYRVDTDTGVVVVRVSDPSSSLLAIDRESEYVNSVRAAAVGVGAPVVDYLPGRGVLVVGFLPSHTFGDEDVAANLGRIGPAVRRLHEAERFQGRFDIFAVQAHYRAIVAEHGFPTPEGYDDYRPVFERCRAALAVHPEPLVSCHNDLLPANLLDDGERVRIIDYEYAGLNEPSFELGNLIQEARLTPDHLAELVAAYAGRPDPARAARAAVFGTVAAYTWTLWGSIQSGVSDLDVDFTPWAVAKYDAARAGFADPRLPGLLDRVGEGR